MKAATLNVRVELVAFIPAPPAPLAPPVPPVITILGVVVETEPIVKFESEFESTDELLSKARALFGLLIKVEPLIKCKVELVAFIPAPPAL